MSEIAVQVATASATYSGRGAGPEQAVRLVDLLRLVSMLVIADCSVLPLGRSDAIVSGATCRVPVSRLVWAMPVEEALGKNRTVSEYDRLEKIAHPVLVVATPFLVRGNLHLAPEADPVLAFERLTQGFFPLTGAKVTYFAGESTSWEAPVLVVNGIMVEAFGIESAPAGRVAA